jgi:hypothetical protein
MLAGFAWKWISKKDKTKKDIEIQGIRRMWNHCTEGWVHTPEAIYEDLLEYISNVYYVLMTRGIRGTYLYVCDDNLREYLSQYMEVEK